MIPSLGFQLKVIKQYPEDAFIPILNEEDALVALIVLLGKRSENLFTKAMSVLGYPVIKQMDEVATFAMWSSSNVNYSQQREIDRHLCSWFHMSLVASESKVKRLLGKKFVVPVTGTYQVGHTKVDWSCRDPVTLLLHFITGVANCSTRTSFGMVDVVVSIDHGKGFSRGSCVYPEEDLGQWHLGRSK